MRTFLYLSPYFPPLAQVGALRPLKFARHLPAHGWRPVVLCDLWPGAKVDPTLADLVPASTIVVRDWSRRAAAAHPALHREPAQATAPTTASWADRWLPAWLNNPELVPLGEHGPEIPYAIAAAEKALRAHPCEAIVVNADPYAACLVGAELKRRTGLPLVLDLRDPWAPCQLRRPRRPAPVRWLEDRLERHAVTAADRVILNTHGTLADYRAHYADLDPARFLAIRNHYDADLVAAGKHPGFDRFTLLFLGRFARFQHADVLLNALAELKQRGVGDGDLQLVVTGDFPETAWTLARGLGVQRMVHLHPHVPYREIGAVMAAADVLVALVQPGVTQRIASKLYDYLGAERPVISIGDNPELLELLETTGAGIAIGHGDRAALADRIQVEMALGRQRQVPRRPAGVTSAEAAAHLAGVLDAVTQDRT